MKSLLDKLYKNIDLLCSGGAYAATISHFLKGIFMSRYTIRTVPDIRKHLEKLNQAVDTKFIRPLLMVISATKWKGRCYHFL